jgi:radical SAM superfamily enzyme YgiQ (UPF0313 family)
MVFVRSLGCKAGCNFCATSYHFRKRVIPLFSGDELFSEIRKEAKKHPRIKSAVIYDEDFLADRSNIETLKNGLKYNRELRERPLHFTVFASLRSIQQYNIQELIEAGIGTLYIGVESFKDEIIQNEKLKKRIGAVNELFEKLHRHGINTLGSLIVGWDGQTIEDATGDAEDFVKLNPTFYQIVPLHPVPGTPLWGRIKKEARLVKKYRLQNDGIGQYIFKLKNMSNSDALSLISQTYKNLVNEGGPWPFRIAENQLNGFLTLKNKPAFVFKERAESYRKMLFQILPLALLSGILFKGEKFRKRWKIFRKTFRTSFAIKYYSSWITSIFILPLLVIITVAGRLRHKLKSWGDQPEKIRVFYPGINGKNDCHVFKNER